MQIIVKTSTMFNQKSLFFVSRHLHQDIGGGEKVFLEDVLPLEVEHTFEKIKALVKEHFPHFPEPHAVRTDEIHCLKFALSPEVADKMVGIETILKQGFGNN